MIFFAAPTGETWGMEEYLQQYGAQLTDRVRIVTYDDIVAHRGLPLGTYIFAAIDQLSPTEREIARQCWQELSGASRDIRLINHPTEVLGRYRLLNTCFERGRNAFSARRALEFARRQRFPVFVRPEGEHGGSLTPLLHNRWQLAQALAKALVSGYRLRDLIIVEYCDTADRSGIFRQYCATIAGDRIMPQVLVHNLNWITKWQGRLVDADKAQEQLDYVKGNPHAEWLRETFALAKIGYGRIDYGLKGGVPQVWEINTNPTIVRRAGTSSTMSEEQRVLLEPVRQDFIRQLRAALAELDSAVDPHRRIRIDVSRRQISRLAAEKRLRLRLQARRTAISTAAHAPLWLWRRLRVR